MYIMEGEIEERFIKSLKAMGVIAPGRIEVFNLMQQRLKVTSGLLTMIYDRVIGIIDTDIVNHCELENLVFNLKMLSEVSKKPIYLLVQNKNFEDELCFMASVNSLQMLLGLKCHTLKDIKKFLAQKVDYEKLSSRVVFDKYCTRGNLLLSALDNESLKLPNKTTIKALTNCK